ncbi:zinc-dependent alcohol dehydrogenase [Sporosarcina obsidiansis]|uniref:zinc-dependent alcohol dehydrogenase n=1 Tax=Sporosarcina obsidiansis TaxID=2660748 RepID=UPI00129BA55F|nr:zinc-binding dehydrogenase [Sporosarcina obsidiansis]
MKTLIVSTNGKLDVIEIEKPEITSKQALIKTICCGICGTDATIVNRTFKGFEEEHYPLMLGHEGVGEVVEIGEDVTSFQKGDIVILPFTPPIDCQGQLLNSGWGSFSEYGIVDDIAAYDRNEIPEAAFAQKKLPDFVDKYEAPVLVTLREVLSSIKYFNIQPTDAIIVYGSGPVAMTFVKLLNLLGVKEITSIVRSEKKQALMEEFGASSVINSSTTDIKEQVFKQHPSGVKFVLDAVGSEKIMNEAIGLLKDRGEILCYGVPKVNSMLLNWDDAPYNWKLNFQQMPYKEEEGECHEQIMDWVLEGKLKLRDFISDFYSFEDILTAFQDYLDGKTFKKVIVKY